MHCLLYQCNRRAKLRVEAICWVKILLYFVIPFSYSPIQYTNAYIFRKMVTITLYARQQKRHRCIEQSFGLCGRGRGGMILENGIETCIISYKKWITSPGSMQDTGSLGLVHWDDPEGWYGEGGGREEGGSGLGTRVHPWRIHVDVWQNQYNIVK